MNDSINDQCSPKEIDTKRDIESTVNKLVESIQEVIREELPETRTQVPLQKDGGLQN